MPTWHKLLTAASEHDSPVDRLEKLHDSLNTKLSEVRLAAIFALGELGPEVLGKEAVEATVAELTRLKRTSEKAIAEAAETTIQKLKK